MFRLFLLALIVCCDAASIFDIPFETSSYETPLEAVSDDGKTAAYGFYKLNEKTIDLAVACNTQGYCGFGLNDNQPGMLYINLYMCHV
jgi:hypothetical protein